MQGRTRAQRRRPTQSLWGRQGGGPGWGLTKPPCLPAVELKIEVVLPEKERGKEELSASGKGSPRAYQGNGTARHFHTEERLPAPHPYPGTQDCVEAAVCHVKDLENGQWVLGLGGGPESARWEGKVQAMVGAGRVAHKGPMASSCPGHLWLLLVWACSPEGWALGGGAGRRGAWCVA